MSLVRAITMLRDAFPRAEFTDATVHVYATQLADMDEEVVERAVVRLIRSNTFLPTIGEIRTEAAEEIAGLPGGAEAWDIARSGSLRDAPPEVQASARAVGGRWGILTSTNDAVLRSQFLKDYAERRKITIQELNGTRIPLAAPASLPPAMLALPESERVEPRPVFMRLARRLAGRELEQPTEDEQRDAILILADGPSYPDEPGLDSVYGEAERIFAEASS